MSKAIKAEKQYKLLNKIIKAVENKNIEILDPKSLQLVETFLNKYVWSEQFYKNYPDAKKFTRLDKEKQVKYLLNEYMEIWRLVEELKNKKLNKTEKLNKFIKWLEKIDKGMVELVEEKLEERSNKSNYNNPQ